MRCEKIDYEVFGNGMPVVEVELDHGNVAVFDDPGERRVVADLGLA